MKDPTETDAKQDKTYHAYDTHHIPWYVRAMWIIFWIAAIWYVVKFAVPMVKRYF